MKKICTKCKENKDLEEYYKDARAKDGRQSECKSCHNVMQREYNKTDKGKLTNAKYFKTDKGKVAQAKYDKSNKGKAAIARRNHNRRINIENTLNTLTVKEFNFIVFTAQHNKCIGPDHEGSRYFTDKLKPTRDHIIPVELGGDFTKENIQALCVECNSRKNIKIIDFRTDYHKQIIKTI